MYRTIAHEEVLTIGESKRDLNIRMFKFSKQLSTKQEQHIKREEQVH